MVLLSDGFICSFFTTYFSIFTFLMLAFASLYAKLWRLLSPLLFVLSPRCTIFASMDEKKRLEIEENIVKMLKTVYDPEIPVDIYNLGLVYSIVVCDDGTVKIDMTLTAPNCPASDFIFEDVSMKVGSIDGVTSVETNLVFEPEWDKDMMSEEAKLELGFL